MAGEVLRFCSSLQRGFAISFSVADNGHAYLMYISILTMSASERSTDCRSSHRVRGVSPTTGDRYWKFARTRLNDEMSD